jgi:hypothetical protein
VAKIFVDEKEYPFPELDTITFREARTIKKLTGLRLGEYEDAFEVVDADLMVALAAVALTREDRGADVDSLFELGIDKIRFDFTEEGIDLPPPVEPSPENGASAGDGSSDQSEGSEEPGTPDSSNSSD